MALGQKPLEILHLFLRQPKAKFGAPPNDVADLFRPFLTHQIIDFRFGQSVAEISTQGTPTRSPLQNEARLRSVGPRKPVTATSFEPRKLGANLSYQGIKALHGKIATRQRPMRGPGASRGVDCRKMPSELIECVLRETPIRCDLAAQYGKHRRAGLVQFQHIVSRSGLSLLGAVIV